MDPISLIVIIAFVVAALVDARVGWATLIILVLLGRL